MHGRLSSDERLYLPRKLGGRGLKCIKDAYEETKIRIACYLSKSEKPTHKMVWRRECNKTFISLQKEVNEALRIVGCNISFQEDRVEMEGGVIDIGWKAMWTKVKGADQRGKTQQRIDFKNRLQEKRTAV